MLTTAPPKTVFVYYNTAVKNTDAKKGNNQCAWSPTSTCPGQPHNVTWTWIMRPGHIPPLLQGVVLNRMCIFGIRQIPESMVGGYAAPPIQQVLMPCFDTNYYLLFLQFGSSVGQDQTRSPLLTMFRLSNLPCAGAHCAVAGLSFLGPLLLSTIHCKQKIYHKTSLFVYELIQSSSHHNLAHFPHIQHITFKNWLLTGT